MSTSAPPDYGPPQPPRTIDDLRADLGELQIERITLQTFLRHDHGRLPLPNAVLKLIRDRIEMIEMREYTSYLSLQCAAGAA